MAISFALIVDERPRKSRMNFSEREIGLPAPTGICQMQVYEALE